MKELSFEATESGPEKSRAEVNGAAAGMGRQHWEVVEDLHLELVLKVLLQHIRVRRVVVTVWDLFQLVWWVKVQPVGRKLVKSTKEGRELQ